MCQITGSLHFNGEFSGKSAEPPRRLTMTMTIVCSKLVPCYPSHSSSPIENATSPVFLSAVGVPAKGVGISKHPLTPILSSEEFSHVTFKLE